MFSRNMFYKMCHALSIQRGGPSLTYSNRPRSWSLAPAAPLNRNQRLQPKPMTQEDVAAVRKLTGFAPFVEVKYV